MKEFFTTVSMLYFGLCAFAQVGIGTNSPTTTLDVRAQNHNGALIANDGVLVPRVSSIGAVTGLENGQLVFLTTDDLSNGYQKGFHFWENGSWKPISSGSAGGGKGQQYVGYWYIGDINSNNTTITNISGILTSVMLNASLSSGSNVVYDVVLNDNFLLGDIGTDFIIISELTTDATTNVIRGDSRTHRNVSKLTNNSFRITLNNLRSNSNRRAGITISVLRSAVGSSFNVSNNNYGVFNTLSDVTTAQPTPLFGDQAVISTYNATLAHINSTTVPTNADQYTIYFNGTNWVYIGWQTSPLSGADWVVAPGGFVLDAVTTAPAKATNPEIDQVRYRDLGNNFVEVEYRYGATDASGATAGAGDYLFTLPNNYQFDATAHPIYTSTGVADNSIAAAFALPVDQSAVSENNINGAELLPIPYNATQFRALAYSGDFGDAFLQASRYSFSVNNSTYIIRFTFKRQ